MSQAVRGENGVGPCRVSLRAAFVREAAPARALRLVASPERRHLAVLRGMPVSATLVLLAIPGGEGPSGNVHQSISREVLGVLEELKRVPK